MLKRLKISNFAIIENVELEFDGQLTVITGETGSGKSILLGALNLLLGERADYSVIRDNSGKTIVEGLWLVQPELENFFKENDLDFDHECIIRREILKEGKSRAFINDSPVNLNVLKSLTQQLIHIHSQHNTLELRDKNFQISILDTLGEHQNELKKYRDVFTDYQKELLRNNTFKNQLAQLIKERDFINFQLEELEALKLNDINYAELQAQLLQLEHGEQLLESAAQGVELMDYAEGILPQINRLKQIIGKIAPFSKIAGELNSRVQSVEIELRDIHIELEQFAESIQLNPNEIDRLNEQIDGFNKALRKHQVDSQEALQVVLEGYLSQNQSTNEIEDALFASDKKLSILSEKVAEHAGKLTEARKIASRNIEAKLLPYFERLKLKDAQVLFQLREKTNYDSNGKDSVDLLFSTNSGIAPQPIEKVASGGELGRLMLILMTLLSERKFLPTVIFDEIDTGVSGDVADRIGQLLRAMGKNRQLLTITHLPQVASAGHHHLVVKKSKIGNLTFSEVVKLTEQERKQEIAKLLSGEEISSAALENAENLLAQHD